jgi:hypothetical protein
MSALPTSRSAAAEDTRPFAWFRSLGPEGRRAFIGAFGGYALDAYDFQVLPLGLVAIAASLGRWTPTTSRSCHWDLSRSRRPWGSPLVRPGY